MSWGRDVLEPSWFGAELTVTLFRVVDMVFFAVADIVLLWAIWFVAVFLNSIKINIGHNHIGHKICGEFIWRRRVDTSLIRVL